MELWEKDRLRDLADLTIAVRTSQAGEGDPVQKYVDQLRRLSE